jgi:hypothetical protein
MNLNAAKAEYVYFSGEASKLARQLALAALGVVWIFKAENQGAYSVPHDLIPVAALAVSALAIDFLQYIYGAMFWGYFHRMKERDLGAGSEADFIVPPIVNWPTIGFFWAKIAVTAIAYFFLIGFLAQKLDR